MPDDINDDDFQPAARPDPIPVQLADGVRAQYPDLAAVAAGGGDPDYYAVWKDGQWQVMTKRSIKQALTRMCRYRHPECKGFINATNEAFALIDAEAVNTETASWNQSTNSIPLADGDKSVSLQSGAVIATPRNDYMLERLPVTAAELESADLAGSKFKTYMEQWHADASRREFLQMACGQALAGNPAHTIVDCVGVGRNGKGAFINFLRRAAGPYLCTIDTSYFVKGQQRHEAGLTPLKHARFAVIGEFESSAKINTALLKNISAADELMVSNKGGKPFAMRPHCMPVIHGNAELSVNDVSAGLRGRWKKLRWLFRMDPEAVVDPAAMEATAAAERGAVLRWIIDGLIMYRRRKGYGDIGAVAADTASYFEEENTVELILRAYATPEAGKVLKIKDLVDDANKDGVYGNRWTTRAMSKKLRESGILVERDRQSGLAVLNDWRSRYEGEQPQDLTDEIAQLKLPGID